MSDLEFSDIHDCSLVVSNMDEVDGTMEIGTDWCGSPADYTLSKSEAFKLWKHIGREFNFKENKS